MKKIKLWHKPVTPDQATALTSAYEKAFEKSNCDKCPGLCCSSCAENNGHLLRGGVSPNKIIALKMQYGWNELDGFSSKSGCKIPLEERSLICVGFFCGMHLNLFMAGVDTPGNQLEEPIKTEVLENVGKFQQMLSDLDAASN